MLSPKEQHKLFLKMLNNPEKGNNGGNPKASLWFCGIENNPGDIGTEHNQRLLNDKSYVRMPNQDFTTFNSAIRTILRELDLIGDVKTADEMYQSDNFYCANLLPFALNRNSDDIDKEIFELSGLPMLSCYEHVATYIRTNYKWYKFSENAQIIVCFSKQEKYISMFMDMFSNTLDEWYRMRVQLTHAQENNREIICLQGYNRVLIFTKHPSAYRGTGKNATLSKIANLIQGYRNDFLKPVPTNNELYEQALKVVSERKYPSISYLQRRLDISYDKAAYLIGRMEVEGIISEVERDGKRRLLQPKSTTQTKE